MLLPPPHSMQYGLSWERESINGLIERAILDADARGVKVLSLGLLNQAKQLNGGGELFRHRYPKLRVRLVDGSGLATAVVLRSIPRDAKQVLLHAGPSKIACATAAALCERGVQVCLFAAFICTHAQYLSCCFILRFLFIEDGTLHYNACLIWCLVEQVVMNPNKEYDMLKSQIADSKASYWERRSDNHHTPQVKRFCLEWDFFLHFKLLQ